VITPEPTAIVLNDDWTLGLAPAAGRLGVIEEKCSALHGEADLAEDGLPFPCPACGAAV